MIKPSGVQPRRWRFLIANRNERRGFHNTWVFYRQISKRELNGGSGKFNMSEQHSLCVRRTFMPFAGMLIVIRKQLNKTARGRGEATSHPGWKGDGDDQAAVHR